jgi:hypothetical protein
VIGQSASCLSNLKSNTGIHKAYEGCRTTHGDEHASALKPGAAASEESHNEDDYTHCNADTVSTDHAVLREELSIACVGQPKPDTHAQDPTATQLKQSNKQLNGQLLILKIFRESLIYSCGGSIAI